MLHLGDRLCLVLLEMIHFASSMKKSASPLNEQGNWRPVNLITRFFYKKLGSGHSTKSFLISHEILSILVLKVS